MLWPSKSHLEKSGVFFHPNFPLRRIRQTPKLRTQNKWDKPETSLPEIPENGWRGSKSTGFSSIFTRVLERVHEIFISSFQDSTCHKLSVDEIKQLGYEFDVHYVGENRPWMGEIQCASQTMKHSSWGILGRASFIVLDEAVPKEGMIC